MDGPEGNRRSELMDFSPPIALELADVAPPFQTVAYVARVTHRLDLVIAIRSDKRYAHESRATTFVNSILHQLRDEASFEELLPKR